MNETQSVGWRSGEPGAELAGRGGGGGDVRQSCNPRRHGGWGLLETIKHAFSADLSSPAAAWELLPGRTQTGRVSGSSLPRRAANSQD